jgi:outer membrane immunogenic protein
MKRAMILGIGALALAGTTIPTEAADMPRKAPPVVAPAPPPFSWSGCYVGGNLGAKWGSFDGDANLAAVGPLFPLGTSLVFAGNRDSEVGFIGGGQVGCQWQTGSIVLGIESDFVLTDIGRTFVAPGFRFPALAGDTFTLENDWQASLRGRLGWAFDRWMIYVTGGVAWANFELSAALIGAPPLFPAVSLSADKTLVGATIGGGFEYAFTPNWSLGVEYRFTKFDRENFGLGNVLVVAPATLSPFAANAELETHEVTARVNYRFNLFGPY